jgi:hypothetical protein
MTEYKHTQIGYFLLFKYSAAVLLLGAITLSEDFHPIPLAWLILLLIAWRTFATLTVSISDRIVRIQYGVKFARKDFPLDDIEGFRPVKNPWYYGWGIRFTPRGWLYAVSGLSAIELQMKSGKRYRIGTDEPDALATALEEALRYTSVR